MELAAVNESQDLRTLAMMSDDNCVDDFVMFLNLQ